MSSDSEDDSAPPPPARHDTGRFDRIGGPGGPPGGGPPGGGDTGVFVSSTGSNLPDYLEASGAGHALNSGINSPSERSPMSYSSFKWDKAQSFRLYATNSKQNMIRRNTSFGLGNSQSVAEYTPISPQMSGATSGLDSQDPKAVIKSCLSTIKSYISLHGTPFAQGNSSLEGNLKKGPSIGQGGYATVYVGINTSTGELVAVKEIIIEGTQQSNPEQFRAIEDEFVLLRKLKHKNIISYSLFEHSNSAGVARIVMDFCSGGSTQAMQQRFETIPEPICKHFAQQIFSGLAFIHKEGIIHRDIKPANILVQANGTVKLADFGCSRRIGEMAGKASHVLGTPVYMAPEYIKGQTHRKSDVWAVACTLLELATGKVPWHHTKLHDNLSLMFHISTSYEKPQIPYSGELSDNFIDFLTACFERDVDRRPEAEELLDHPWLTTPAEEDEEGVDTVEQIVADQCSELCENITSSYKDPNLLGAHIALTSNNPSESDLRSHLSGFGGSQNLPVTNNNNPDSRHVSGELGALGDSSLRESQSFLMVRPLGSTQAASGSMVMEGYLSKDPSRAPTPTGGSFTNSTGLGGDGAFTSSTSGAAGGLEVVVEGAGDEDVDAPLPTGPVKMAVPVEAMGRSMTLDLEVRPQDLQEVKAFGRRKSFAVNFSDDLRSQIQHAMAAESLKSPRNSSPGASPVK